MCDLPGYDRGRDPGVVSDLIREMATSEGVPQEVVTMFNSPIEGVRKALADAVDGDCLVLLALTQRDEVLAMIQTFVEDI